MVVLRALDVNIYANEFSGWRRGKVGQEGFGAVEELEGAIHKIDIIALAYEVFS